MPTDDASVLELIQAIGNVTHDLNKEGASLSNNLREELIRNAEKLAIAAREPEEKLVFPSHSGSYYRASGKCKRHVLTTSIVQTAQNSAIRTAISMGIFGKIPLSGSGIDVTELSAKLQVDRHLLSKSSDIVRNE